MPLSQMLKALEEEGQEEVAQGVEGQEEEAQVAALPLGELQQRLVALQPHALQTAAQTITH